MYATLANAVRPHATLSGVLQLSTFTDHMAVTQTSLHPKLHLKAKRPVKVQSEMVPNVFDNEIEEYDAPQWGCDNQTNTVMEFSSKRGEHGLQCGPFTLTPVHS